MTSGNDSGKEGRNEIRVETYKVETRRKREDGKHRSGTGSRSHAIRRGEKTYFGSKDIAQFLGCVVAQVKPLW